MADTPAVHAFKLIWDTKDRVWRSMDPKGYEENQAILQHAHQWFLDHPVTLQTFDFPDADKWEFWRYSLEQFLKNEHVEMVSQWMLALYNSLPM